MKSKLLPFVVFICLISLFTFSSCGDDDEGGVNTIVGTWVLVRNIDTECNDPDNNLDEMVTCDADNCLTFIFNADGTFRTIEIEDGVTTETEGMYSASGNLLILSTLFGNIGFAVSFDFTLLGNSLTIVDRSSGTDCTFTSVLEKT